MLKTNGSDKTEKEVNGLITEINNKMERMENGMEMETGLNGIRLETSEQKEIVEIWNGNMEKEIREKMERMEKEVNGLTSDKPELTEVLGKGEVKEMLEEMLKEVKELNSEIAEKRETSNKGDEMETGSVKVKMVKGMVKEYFAEAENQDGSEIWEEMSVKEIKEDLGIWLNAYGPGGTDITEKGDEMLKEDGKVNWVKEVVTEYFEESENQDGMEVWEGMTREEIKEDLAIWLNAYGS